MQVWLSGNCTLKINLTYGYKCVKLYVGRANLDKKGERAVVALPMNASLPPSSRRARRSYTPVTYMP